VVQKSIVKVPNQKVAKQLSSFCLASSKLCDSFTTVFT